MGSSASSRAVKCQTNLVLSVRSASFAPAKAGRAHGYCRVLTGRSLAGYCGVLADMRSIAAIGVFVFRARTSVCFGSLAMFATVGTERNGGRAKRGQEVKWRGAVGKAGESDGGRGRNRAEAVRYMSRTTAARTAALGAKEADSLAGQPTEAQVSAL